MSKIFISYRREDSADTTGRIYDRLVQQFGQTAVFKDVDSIPLGINFRKYLDDQVAKCDVFLAVIGPDWMGSKAGEDKPKLDDPRDFVRIEIESALNRQIPVVPLLVRGATIPDPERLPYSLQELSDRNGIVIHQDPYFHRDIDRLIKHLKLHVEKKLDQAPFQDSHHKSGYASTNTKETSSKTDPLRQGQSEATVPSSKRDSVHRQVNPIEEEPATSSASARTITGQPQSYQFGLIVLIVLLVAGMVFVIIQGRQASLDPTRHPPPQGVQKTAERPGQRTPPPATSIPAEPAIGTRKQEKPMEKWLAQKSSSALTDDLAKDLDEELKKIKKLRVPKAATSVDAHPKLTPQPAPQVETKVPNAKAVDTTLKIPGMASGSNAYLALVRQRIANCWSAPPLDLAGQASVVVVQFRLHRNGAVTGVSIEQSSGNEYYDLAGKRAVLSANPLPVFPAEISDSYFDAHFTFTVGEPQE